MILKQSFFSRFQIEVHLKNESWQYTAFSQIHKTRSREIIYIAPYFEYEKISYEFMESIFIFFRTKNIVYVPCKILIWPLSKLNFRRFFLFIVDTKNRSKSGRGSLLTLQLWLSLKLDSRWWKYLIFSRTLKA